MIMKRLVLIAYISALLLAASVVDVGGQLFPNDPERNNQWNLFDYNAGIKAPWA